MTGSDAQQHLKDKLYAHVEHIYPAEKADELVEKMIALMGLNQRCFMPEPHKNLWDERDCLMIAYGDSLLKEGE